MPVKKKAPVKRVPRKSSADCRHYMMEWDVGDGYRPMTFDARSLTLPAMAVIGVVMAFVWGTYIIVGERNRIDTRIDKVITAIERLADSTERAAKIAEARSQDRWASKDHVLFCAQAEGLNKGWRCPPPISPGVPAAPGFSASEYKILKDAIKDAREQKNAR